MNRRKFLKQSGWVSTGLIFVPRLIRAQVVPSNALNAGNAANGTVVPAGGGGGCATVKDNITDTKDFTDAEFSASARTYFANYMVAGSNYTICGFSLDVYKNSSPVMTVTPYIYGAGTSKPAASALATGTPVSASSFPTVAGTMFKFTGFSLALTASTVYWLVLGASAVDGTNNINCDFESTSYPGGSWPGFNTLQISSNGSTWNTHSNEQARFNTYA